MTKKIHTDVEIDGTLSIGGQPAPTTDTVDREIFMLGGM
jgi:hypothetical protein